MTNEFQTLRTNIKLVNNPQQKHLHIVDTGIIKPKNTAKKLPSILFITSYPPRECGIATYSQDLIKALNNKYSGSFDIQICALESEDEKHTYTKEITHTLNTDDKADFAKLANSIGVDPDIAMVVVQHEFGFFRKNEDAFYQFLRALTKPVIVVFHTVLPKPDVALKLKVKQISAIASSIIVMTHSSENILIRDYNIPKEKMTVIAHGTHLVPYLNKANLKNKYSLSGKTILSTFGLLSSGKNIETTLKALPAIVKSHPDVLFLIIGKTHPTVVKHDGEKYRALLEEIVETLHLQQHVLFVNSFLPLPVLLEYLQLTDIYLFTSNNPNQAVSGTFSYAISCGCPVVSTPIPHAIEVLKNDAGIIVDFENAKQLSDAVISLLNDEQMRKNISSKGLHRMAATAWENSAIAHAMLLEKIGDGKITLHSNLPEFNLDHIKKLTTGFGMIQFSKINEPDMDSGYTLDDNARAMVAMCQHFELTRDEADLKHIEIYLDFIKFCLQPNGDFLNYVDEQQQFTEQNYTTNLEDSNGRAIWALGYLLSMGSLLPSELTVNAEVIMQKALINVIHIHSTRAMAFIIKGIYYADIENKNANYIPLIKELSNRLVQMYRHEASPKWLWFESYLTYANSILPEAMLCAGIATGDTVYLEIAKASFDFLLSKTFTQNGIKVISNKGWLNKKNEFIQKAPGGEQPIDIAYAIMALGKFYNAFTDEHYRNKMNIAFDWFLGNNHLHQIIYNPCTGGCYDGLEENNVNLNQGAESTVSYLMARLTIEKLRNAGRKKFDRSKDLSFI